MSKVAVEQAVTGNYVRISAYDSTKWNFGTLINIFTDDSTGLTYIGPNKVGTAHPGEELTSVVSLKGLVPISISSTIDYIFLFENPTSGTTLRIFLYEYNRVLSTFNWRGLVTTTFNTAATHTVKGVQMGRYLHTTGTVSVSGTAVTGVSTLFTTDRIAVGARIGFGSTDPTAITDWYPISAITNDTTLTIARSAGTIGAGTSYVIEEFRSYIVTSNSTTTNGGLFVTKGINPGDFTATGTTFSASAATTDNLKLGYWLADAGTVTNTVAMGCVLDAEVSKTTQYLYVIDGNASPIKMYRYNVRANDSILSGKMTLTGSNTLVTATQTITGSTNSYSSMDIATTSHGPGSGIKSLYFTTTTRIYRVDVANIVASATNWISDNRVEIPPGGINTYAAGGSMSMIEYMSDIDRFLINASTLRSYLTVYPTTSGDKFTHVFGIDTRQLDQSLADASIVTRFDPCGTSYFMSSVNGVSYIHKIGGTTNGVSNGQLYALPFGAHWTYASTTNQRAITPSISTPNCSKFVRFYMNTFLYIGTTNVSEIAPEAIRAYYRTSGISDNSGGWTLISDTGDLSSATAASAIQFMFEFKTVGNGLLVPGRLLGCTVVHEDETTLSKYAYSIKNSSISSKIFSWKFVEPFGTTVPTLRIRIYDAITGVMLIDDDTVNSTYGTWSKSTNDGSSWGSYNTTDKANETTYIRYIPTTLVDNVNVRTLLTLI